MSITKTTYAAGKLSIAKLTCRVMLSIVVIAIFNQFSYSQIISNKSPKFQSDSLTIHYSNKYLSSVFDGKIADSVQIIALGEVSHGGYEPIAFKANMARYLIERKGYRNILFELPDVGRMRAMRNYLTNQTSNDTAYIGTWVKQAQFVNATASESLGLLKWIKQYNLNHPEDMVQVMGFEIGTGQSIISFILNKYIIPYDRGQGQQYMYQLTSDIADTAKITILNKWLLSSQSLLKTKISAEELRLLDFYIHNSVNGVGYLIKNSKAISEQSNAANLFRDSVMAQNIRFLSNNRKAIVWAHNGHVIRTVQGYMGNYLHRYFKDRYYVIASDFSKLAEVEINKNASIPNNNPQYITKTFTSAPTTAAYNILNKYGIAAGIFFEQDLRNMNIKEDTNAIDANGIHLFIPGLNNAFDALVFFSEIHPTAKQTSN
ncbi:erythromycin esterase family protein [Mucilaginibacter flavus]|uniref:erythromycin esterase family protein n=1 Tax=Mucilaginibacter flavus TaxID=931504 RepID=UPI0025B4FA3D|nr:erythromycin esterase family protein [Mucilaginibacter flavus]MDN3582070.1 erythromycin esterase family protein [Mucilaginibacter flavus]